jgi:transcriptional regulator of acetoin/glycerol metabolism
MTGGHDSSTLTATDEPFTPSIPDRAPHLFLVLESHHPLAPPLRIHLSPFDQLTFGRGSARTLTPAKEGAARRLSIRLVDPWLSTRHARLTRVLRRWVIEDLDSKNGTFVDGVRQARAELEDGQIVEIGHTFFLFREGVEHARGAPPIFDAGQPSPPRGLATLLPDLARTFARLVPVARSTVPVLLQGETGTGKEVLARNVHALSARAGEFVAVNCGALPPNMVEAELFGHERGAFTGAAASSIGLVRAADHGTLLLDEVGDLPLPAQAALLRILQEREVRPVGGRRAIHVDLRVVAATHRPLDRMVQEGAFRVDLLARLAGHRVDLPPLRDRREDMGLLVAALIQEAAEGRAGAVTLSPRAARALLRYSFPGNVRELEKCLTTALVLAEDGKIDVDHLPEAVRCALDDAVAAKREEDEARKADLVSLLREHGGNVTAVATALGKARMQVQRWLKRYEIDPSTFRRP